MARDLIITCFSRPGQSQLRSAGLGMLTPDDVFPVSRLERAVDVISLEKGMAGHIASGGKYCDQGDVWGGFCFDELAKQLRAAGAGSVLRGAILKKNLNPTDYEGGRIALVAFSAGHTMLGHLVKSEEDAQKIDTLISLDGIAFPKVNGDLVDVPGYMNFARRACGIDRMGGAHNPYLGPLMVIAHTRIASPAPTLVSATYEASRRIFWRLSDPYMQKLSTVPKAFVDQMGAQQKEVLARFSRAIDSLPYPLKINCGTQKTFTRETANPGTTGYLGNLWDFEFNGTGGADHCFIAYAVQKALMEAFLLPRWNAKSPAVAGLGGLGGFGADSIPSGPVTFQSPTEATRGGGLLNAGALGPGHVSLATLGLGVLAAVGGYHLGKHLWEKI